MSFVALSRYWLLTGTNPAFEDDMVTLLWSEHFQGLTYSVIDNYAEDITDEDNAEYTVSNVIERVRTRGQFLLDTGLTSADGASRRSASRHGWCIISKPSRSVQEVVFDMDRAEYRRLQRRSTPPLERS